MQRIYSTSLLHKVKSNCTDVKLDKITIDPTTHQVKVPIDVYYNASDI